MSLERPNIFYGPDDEPLCVSCWLAATAPHMEAIKKKGDAENG